jgi:hypothetical protein
MPITVNSRGPRVPGAQVFRRVTITLDSSYVTGGEPVTFGDLGISRLEAIIPNTRNAGYLATWDGSLTAPKIKMFQQSAATGALTEVPNATNLATVVVDLLVVGY